MRVRIQPKSIEIPENDPFDKNLFDWKEPIKILTNLVGNIEGPCVMAVDAPWGAGKTTFINIWHQYLRNEKFFVVKFNAWENDFSNDPFIALVEELVSGLESGKLDKFKQASAKVVKYFALSLASNAVRIGTSGLVDPEGLIENSKGKGNPDREEFEKRLSAYRGAKRAIEGIQAGTGGNGLLHGQKR